MGPVDVLQILYIGASLEEERVRAELLLQRETKSRM